MTELEKQLNELIELKLEKESLERYPVCFIPSGAAGVTHDANYPNRKFYCERFKKGNALLMPLLFKCIEQRDSLRMDCPGYDLSESDNKELLQLLENV